MVRGRTSMRQIRDVLWLCFEKRLSANEISKSTSVSRGSVQGIIKKAKEIALSLDQINSMKDDALEAIFFPPVVKHNQKKGPVVEPDFLHVHREMKRKGVTLELLWQEYHSQHPNGWCYAHFTKKYRRWKHKINLVMKQEHKAGDKLFVDFAGHTMRIIDRNTGEVHNAQIFVAVLGASNYCFVKAYKSQDSSSWIKAHIDCLTYLDGVPVFVVPDNLKSAVTKACRFEPLINRTYSRLAHHYGFAIMPARPRHPKDKAKAEAGVKLVENWILAALRDRDFFSLEELNEAIAKLLEVINEKPFQKLSGNRKSWFASVDKPALKPLPSTHFEIEQWLVDVPVPRTYHIEIDGHHYSVSHKLVGQEVDARLTDNTVELFHNNQRIASHARSSAEARKSTIKSHMPKAHKLYAGQTSENFIRWAERIGEATTSVVKIILASKPYPQLSFDQCFGLLHYLKNKYSPAELEIACHYARALGTPSYKMVKQLLAMGVHNLPKQLGLEFSTNFQHNNIRGPEYYT